MVLSPASLLQSAFRSYTSIVLGWPRLTILLTVLFSFCLSFLGAILHYDVIDFTPSTGFETRGTRWADTRLSLIGLKDAAATRLEMVTGKITDNGTKRAKRAIEDTTLAIDNTTEIEDFTVNYDDYGINSNPRLSDIESDACVQYGGLGTDIPYEYMDLLAKLTFEYDDIDQLFSLPVMQSLCSIDEIARSVPDEGQAANFKSSFNLPLYSTCLNMESRKSCSALNQKDLDHLKETLLSCKNGSNPDKELCQLAVMEQATTFLLPKDISKPYINVILPYYIASNSGKNGLTFFLELKRRVEKEVVLKLRGTYFLTKEAEFLSYLPFDCFLALISALLVFSLLYTVVRSALFTATVILLLLLSFGLAFFAYTVVSNEEVLLHSLPHSLGAVTVTSITTAIAFLVNLTSDVLILKCFGIFASLVVLFNLILLYLLLPSSLSLVLPSLPDSSLHRCVTDAFNCITSHLSIITTYFRYPLSILFAFLSILSVFIIFISPGLDLPQSVNVQLLLPSHTEEWYDSHSNLFDWSSHRKFTLIQNVVFGVLPVSDASPVNPYDSGHVHFDPSFRIRTLRDLKRLKNLSRALLQRNKLRNDTTLWLDVFMDWMKSKSCTEQCCTQGKKYLNVFNTTCFLEYSKRFPVSTFPSDWTTFPIDGPIFDKQLRFVGYFFSFPSRFKWSLDWDVLKAFFKDLDSLDDDVKRITNYPGEVSASTQILRVFDLLSLSLPSTLQSLSLAVALCLLLVLISLREFIISISTIISIAMTLLYILASLVLMGWRLGVIESSIIILATGVAFDYVLHYAVAYSLSPPLPLPARIRSIHSSAGSAVVGGSLSAAIAALPLLFSSTSAFSQLGTFLFLVSILSLLSATVIFPSIQASLQSLQPHSSHLKF